MKHKVIGLFAVYGLYSALGLFGIYLRAGEPNTPPKPPPNTLPLQVAAPAPLPPRGQLQGFGGGLQGGLGGGQVQGDGFKGGGFTRKDMFPRIDQINPLGKKVVGIEDGPTQILAATEAGPTPPAKEEFVNPKVEPGKVKWHADFDTACKAAAKSGKPVLLFQMMGKLDDQFC